MVIRIDELGRIGKHVYTKEGESRGYVESTYQGVQ